MEALPPYSRASMTLHPMRSAFPPDGAVSVAPQTEQAITLVAFEKITTSAPQSLHDTFKKLLAIKSHHLSTNSNFFALLQGA
tara:strand:+ start:176 stop:421 length:246 start_codon:yes stop_codon:yes gene_type:complete